MTDSPPIHNKSRTIFFLLGRLDGQIGVAHQPLAEIIEAVEDVVVRVVDKVALALVVDAFLREVEHTVQKGADVAQTVQLVKDRDVVLLLALWTRDPGREVVFLGLLDYDEAISRLQKDISPRSLSYLPPERMPSMISRTGISAAQAASDDGLE